jgi:hypothetical protein
MPSKKDIAEPSDSSGPDEVLREYQYAALKSRNSIRILCLKPGKRRKDSQIVCELVKENLDELGITYEALSGAWGPSDVAWTQETRISSKKDEDFFFKVPPDLHVRLKFSRTS